MNIRLINPLIFIIIVSLTYFTCQNSITDPAADSENLDFIFNSSPDLNVFHNELYQYTVSTAGGHGEVVFNVENCPAWLLITNNSRTVSGIASADNLGLHYVRLSASDNDTIIYQNFSVEVNLQQVSGGPWIGHFPHNWQHDGHPLIAENSIIYSDAAGDNVKEAISYRVEFVFNDLLALFNITNADELTFISYPHKVDIYANRFNTEYLGGWAYNAGAIIISPDSPHYQPYAGWSANQIEHEMMHIMEFLLEGGRANILSEVWFREGLADYYAGNHEIISVNDMEAWLSTRRSLPGGGNPIQIRAWNDFPAEVAEVGGEGRWYPMFELAVRYLLDENGLNKSMVDVKNMFFDMDVEYNSFPQALERNMDISRFFYESNFWDLMEDFLN